MAIMDYIAALVAAKATLAANITSKGINAASSEPMADLADKVGDIVTGSDTSDATAIASDILSPKTAYGSAGTKVTGTLVLTGDAAAGDVLSGKKFYKDDPKTQVTGTLALTGDAAAGDVRTGKTFYKDDPNSKITGTFAGVDTSDANAVAADIASGKTAYVNGLKITGSATLVGADQVVSNRVVALLHMNGANNGTTFTDESGKVWTAYYNAKTSTSTKKFGTAGLCAQDGTGAIGTPAHPDFAFLSGDWTIDFWVYKTGVGSPVHKLCGQVKSGSRYWNISSQYGNIAFEYYENDVKTIRYYTANNVISANTWTHIAVERYGNTMLIFVDGVSKTLTEDTTINGKSMGYVDERLVVSSDVTNGSSYANYDEFRVSKGIARWTTDFTPPTSEYT